MFCQSKFYFFGGGRARGEMDCLISGSSFWGVLMVVLRFVAVLVVLVLVFSLSVYLLACLLFSEFMFVCWC